VLSRIQSFATSEFSRYNSKDEPQHFSERRKTEATYTSNRGDDSDASKAANNEKPSAKSALASALTAAKADDKKLLVHFGSPG